MYWLLIATFITVIGTGLWLTGVIPGILNRAGLSSVYTTTPTPATGASAFCPSNNALAVISAPPAGCYNQAQLLQITPQIWNPGISSPTGKFEATNGIGCKIFANNGAGWVAVEFDQASSSGVCTTSNTYLPGLQVQVQVCEDDSTGCVTGDYKNTQTVMYCPLPSLAGTGLCNAGSGAGYVPFSTTPSASTAPTQYFFMPIVPLLGDDPNGMNSGTSESTTWTWQNSTQSTAATTNQCFVNTGAKACDLPTATSIGNFFATVTLQPVGTLPASPQSIGYASFTPIDPSLQSGTLARGPLNYVFTFEIKATTNNDMCTISSTTLPGTFAGPFSRGGSSTDQMYYVIIPDTAITHTTDASGNVITSGVITANITFNCNQVYNGSGDVVAFCASQWAFFSVKYFGASNYNTVNPEAVKTGNAGATPTVNSSDNLGLTCSASAYTVLIKT